MSCLENEKIMEACSEDFIDLFYTDASFKKLVKKLISVIEHNDLWLSCVEGEEGVLSEIVRKCWNFDSELLCNSKRDCVEAYIMYIESMSHLKRLMKGD